MKKYELNINNRFTLKDAKEILESSSVLELSNEARLKIQASREYLDKRLQDPNQVIYGINTGFGSLCNVKVESKDLEDLQRNLVRSHACGIGREVMPELVRVMLLLKIRSLSYGNSGVSLETVERLIFFFNENILPVVYEQGSLGASGDLAPLAHLSLPLIGEGEVYFKGRKMSTQNLFSELQISPVKLKSKEGLALLNGTQFMSAYGVFCCLEAKKLLKHANEIAAMSLDAFHCKADPFHTLIHKVRPHNGQINTAKDILGYLSGSEIMKIRKEQVQDPYSFRCIPQIHGASSDTIQYCSSVFETEINSVSDNPLIFPDENEILSGGNFHGQPLALALDFLAIAMSELASVSERRIYLLISGQRGLPPFLTKKSGVQSGFMITQYTAASIVSQNKQLATPASVDSIVSSNGQEDHVSMGANAATKCLSIVENVRKVLAIELLNSAQALEFRRPKASSDHIEDFHRDFRKSVSQLTEDRIMSEDISRAIQFLELRN